MSPTMSNRSQTYTQLDSSPSTTSLETALPRLSIRTSLRAFDYLPPELTTPIPHLVSPGVHPPPPTASLTSSFSMGPHPPASRFITPDPKALDSLPLISPATHLTTSLTLLVRDHPPSASATSGPARGLLSGPTSIAYLFLQLSTTHPTLDISTRTPSEWCREYLRAASTSHSRHPSTRRGGIQDEPLAYACVKAALTKDSTYLQRALTLTTSLIDTLDADLNEWLYGRAGTLYLLRVLQHHIPSAAPTITPLLHTLTTSILTFDRSTSGPWTWHQKSFLGAAHGDIGIITQCVLSAPTCIDPALTARLSSLLDEQLPSGNWASSRGSSKHAPRDELVQFCHGAPGFVVSLLAIGPYFPALKGRIEEAVRRGRDAIWERGFLSKEPCLCHGIVGNALALDRVRRERMLRMATPEVVGRGVSEGAFVPGSDAYGLMWGEAGRAWVWGVGGGREGRLVGYTDV